MTLGIMNQKRTEILQRMTDAMRAQDENKYLEAMSELSLDIEQSVMTQAQELAGVQDSQILASRGVRQLTSTEKKYYEAVIGAMKSADPKQALTQVKVVMPETVIDSVFEELKTNHPLLSKIDFVNTQGLVKWLMNTNGFQKAVWGKIDAKIVTEVTSGFKEVNMDLMKLSAFIAVSKAMLELGPQWLDRYVREVLYEALANGAEFGFVNNLKTTEGPIGMIADLTQGTVDGDGIKYTAKAAVAITDFQPTTLGPQLAKLAKDSKGNARIIKDVIMLVNPTDYFTKVFPATTVMGADGTYRNDVLPYPITVIQTPAVEEGKAILGLAYRYFGGAGMTSKEGRIEYSDEYQFLEDNRVYLIKLYANGQPKDNNAFVVLDISGLKPAIVKVETVTVE